MKTDDPNEVPGEIEYTTLPPGYSVIRIPKPVATIITVIYDNGFKEEKVMYRAEGLKVHVTPYEDEAQTVSTESKDTRLSLDEQPPSEQ